MLLFTTLAYIVLHLLSVYRFTRTQWSQCCVCLSDFNFPAVRTQKYVCVFTSIHTKQTNNSTVMINAWYPNWPLCPKEVLQWYMDLRTWWPGTGGSIWKILQYPYNSRTTRWLIFYNQLINDNVSGDTVVSHTEPPRPHVSVLLSHSFGSPGRPESRGDESFRGSVSPGQRGSLGPGDRPHHEHDKWPGLPGKHPVGYCSVGRRKHHHSGETTSQTGKRKQPRLLNDIYGVPLPVLRLVFNHRWSFIGPLSVWSVKPTHWIYTM